MDDGIIFTIEVLLVLSWVIAALANDPLFFAWLHISFERAIVVTNHALDRIIETIADIIGSCRDQTWSLNIVHDQSLAIWANTLKHLSVEAAVALRTVLPVLVLEWQVVIEEVVARN